MKEEFQWGIVITRKMQRDLMVKKLLKASTQTLIVRCSEMGVCPQF